MAATEAAARSETRRRLAVGYERWYDDRPYRRDDPWTPATSLETSTADGLLAGTSDDLAVFLRALLNRGRRRRPSRGDVDGYTWSRGKRNVHVRAKTRASPS